jgi:hypothetical protein
MDAKRGLLTNSGVLSLHSDTGLFLLSTKRATIYDRFVVSYFFKYGNIFPFDQVIYIEGGVLGGTRSAFERLDSDVFRALDPIGLYICEELVNGRRCSAGIVCQSVSIHASTEGLAKTVALVNAHRDQRVPGQAAKRVERDCYDAVACFEKQKFGRDLFSSSGATGGTRGDLVATGKVPLADSLVLL